MKPKNKFQRKICELSKQLPPISEKQKYWAFKSFYEDYVVISRNRCFCLDCGHKWEEKPILSVKLCGVTCPACGQKLKFKERVNWREQTYFAIVTTKGDFQVIRMFLFSQFFKMKKASDFSISEVMQHWMDDKGNIESLMQRANSMSGVAIDQWTGGDLEPRTDTYTHRLRQEIGAWKVCPGRRVLPILRRNGFRGHFYGFSPQWLFTELLTSNRAETLLKTNQISILAHINSRGRDVGYYWKSINICNRNNYIVKDASMWFDYLDLLTYFGKDVRNPKFICPPNLRREHDILMNKKNRILEERRRVEDEKQKYREYLKNLKHQEEYKKEKAPFFSIKFKDNELSIMPLKSIDEFKREADVLHHCVFTNEYFTKKESLIMSAQIKGEPVETIEVSLKEFKVVQSRGKHNRASEHHDRILSLVRNNMEQIANVMAV
ncbi:PcfJ domain-containing protein [Carboxylicivirga marina]|uniref:PcfJ domain-containing protein n=1 Tax=Carboxylicivirga marina TaxID=2800988 RepID=A0ABS1HGA9_9BACT|nr:PcfJ domain-containing protein [Carboxylicivirga marina]MBK3516687.1 PcfJ domain-containing protein [Carboxylicivirga marina]